MPNQTLAVAKVNTEANLHFANTSDERPNELKDARKN